MAITDIVDYRADWLPDEDKPNDIRVRFFGNNLKAAQSFARRNSSPPRGISTYVIKNVCGQDVGQWAYHNGFTSGYES